MQQSIKTENTPKSAAHKLVQRSAAGGLAQVPPVAFPKSDEKKNVRPLQSSVDRRLSIDDPVLVGSTEDDKQGDTMEQKMGQQSPTPAFTDSQILKLRTMLSTLNKGSIGGRLKPLSTKLVANLNSSSAPGAALTTVTSISPSSSLEYSTFAALFDEVRVRSIDVHFVFIQSGTVSNSDIWGCLGYDPVDAVVPLSVESVLPKAQHMLVNLGNPASVSLVAPQSRTRNGFWTFRVEMPRGVIAHPGTDQVVGGDTWTPTSAGSAGVYGYLQIVANSLGGTAVQRINGYTIMNVEFRSRV